MKMAEVPFDEPLISKVSSTELANFVGCIIIGSPKQIIPKFQNEKSANTNVTIKELSFEMTFVVKDQRL